MFSSSEPLLPLQTLLQSAGRCHENQSLFPDERDGPRRLSNDCTKAVDGALYAQDSLRSPDGQIYLIGCLRDWLTAHGGRAAAYHSS